MAIPLIREDKEELQKWGWGIEKICERCVFCDNETRFWHENTNNPVCPECAPHHKVSELPDFGQNVRKKKRKQKQIQKVLDTSTE